MSVGEADIKVPGRNGLSVLGGRLPRALAISLGLAEADPEYSGRIRAAQISAVVRLTPVAMIASCINAVILLCILGSLGSLPAKLVVWASALFALALYYGWTWSRRRVHQPGRPSSRRAVRRAIFHGWLFGLIWGAVPMMTFPGGPGSIQLIIGCLTAGMMCAGGFVLATVPLAGWSYVSMILLGAAYALLCEGVNVTHLGLTALLIVYAAVVITNLTWNAQLFVDHFLTEAKLQNEVSARERVQAQVAHAKRMTALAELAGGVAHDFNNILQVVEGNAALIRGHSDDAPQVRALCGRIFDAVDRGSSISRRMLAFARQDTLTAEALDVAELLRGAAEMIGHTLGPAVELRIETQPGLPMLLADKVQFESLLVNLASNARDAMPGGGILNLRAAPEVLPLDREDPPLKAGRYIRISITDTGAGMDAATVARATEPFFTTKVKGKGTGLGLSMAQGFAEQSKGGLAISSAPGYGTTVSIWLPQTDAPATARLPRGPDLHQAADRAERQCVLIVEDDAPVRESMTMALSDAGFAIASAGDGRDALQLLDRTTIVDVLVTDFSMPGMNGIELIRAARTRRPGLPAILLTGHVGDIATIAGERPESGRFSLLQKPVRAERLTECITAALAATAV